MKKPKNKFGIGRAGIESRYYLIHGYLPTTQVTDEARKPAPFDVLRIAADNLDDVTLFLKKWESGFDVRSIKLIGMIVTISGTPYSG
jgi:hypothetical protein